MQGYRGDTDVGNQPLIYAWNSEGSKSSPFEICNKKKSIYISF